MALKEKIVKKFETKEEAEYFIANEWGSTGLLFTWAPLTGTQYNDKPPVRIEMTHEEEEIKKNLMRSITDETRKECSDNELSRNVRNSYAPHPEAKGYLDTK
jgi:hypothetical protein